jgi:aspartyl-tRNA(Asn)/glutamyl-tRNA(Gln) amidotransferase subunit A
MKKGSLSPVELINHCLKRIDSLDNKLNSFCLVCPERAATAAKMAEMAFQGGLDLGPLHGIPYAVKDLYDVKGLATTAGTRLLRGNIASADSTAIRKLTGTGMVMVGKTKTVQFAFGGAGINHDQGTPHNPWQKTHYLPGGSSSGSGVAVAAGMVPAALGTDTGGSVRIPASLCGIVGLKTTMGRISRFGVYPLSWSLDTVGVMARSVEDVALIYQALQGPDQDDKDTLEHPPHDVVRSLKDGVKGLRVAFAESVFWDNVEPEIANAVRDCGTVFEKLGANVDSILFPEAEEARTIYARGMVIAAEGYVVNREWLERCYNELDPIVALRMIKGKDIPAMEYLQNTRSWKVLRAKANDSLKEVDVLIVPATVIPALPVTEVEEKMEVYFARNATYVQNTCLGNILDFCGLVLPCGFTSNGLPIGLMIYGKPFQESLILRVGYAFEQSTDWHKVFPDLSWAEE